MRIGFDFTIRIIIVILLTGIHTGCMQKPDNAVSEVMEEGNKDPLPSWNAGRTKSAVIEFITTTTTSGSEAFIAQSMEFRYYLVFTACALGNLKAHSKANIFLSIPLIRRAENKLSGFCYPIRT